MRRVLGGLLAGLALGLAWPNAARAQTDSTATVVPVDTTAAVPADTVAALAATPKLTLKGYVKLLNTVAIPPGSGAWTYDNLIHNRLNFRWYASEHLTVAVEGRTRFFYGQSLQNNPGFADQATTAPGYTTLGGRLIERRSFLLHAVADRAYVDWTRGKWQVTAGKQRVNWAKSYVWNPNDIFNAYSFFDFDYEERPGTDAVAVRYFTGALSSVEVVAGAERGSGQTTVAGLYKFSYGSYDFQLLAGKRQHDLVVGGGWAGQLRAAGFKGEVTYFQPYRRLSDDPSHTGALLADVSLDYTLPNTLNFRLETLYNSHPVGGNALTYFAQPVTARTLINNHFSAFGAVGYDITPLFMVNLNALWNTDDHSYFLNPTATVSLTDNVELLLAAQVFAGRSGSLYDGLGSYGFTRLKWSF